MNLIPEKNPTGKKHLLIISLCILTVAAAGGLSAWHSHRSGSLSEQPSDVSPVPDEETQLIETNLSAPASVQTEVSDIISESSHQKTDVSVIVTETITEETVLITESSNFSEETQASSVPTETILLETETLLTPDETAPEAVSTFAPVQETTVPSVSETASESVTETAVSSIKHAYRSALESILTTHRFQEETFDIQNSANVDENEFAIYDVDNDGLEELVIRWANTSSSSAMGVIYGSDEEGNLYRELLTTSYMRFYSNGIIEADSAHSSALSGNFWAYTLYEYDNASNSYQQAGYVDAWSKSAFSEDSTIQETFPDYADVSHTGMVYFISHADENDVSGVSDPLDITDYQAWHTSFIGNASELNLPFQKLTESNIANLH